MADWPTGRLGGAGRGGPPATSLGRTAGRRHRANRPGHMEGSFTHEYYHASRAHARRVRRGGPTCDDVSFRRRAVSRCRPANPARAPIDGQARRRHGSRLDLTVRRDALAFNARRAYVATGSYDGVEISFIPHGKGARLWEVGVGVGGERAPWDLHTCRRRPTADVCRRVDRENQPSPPQRPAGALRTGRGTSRHVGTKGQPKQGDNGCEAHQCRGLRRAALNCR